MPPTKFRVNWPFVQERKRKIDFLRPSWNSGRNDFSYFDLQVTPMLPTKFQVNWSFGSGEEAKNRFSRWPHSDRNDFCCFWFTRTPMLPTKFRVNWPRV